MGKSTPTTKKAGSPDTDVKMKCLEHHPQYYLVGGDLFLLIGTTVFRIHSYFFKREAKNFYTKLIDPAFIGDEKRGTTEDTAIIIETATVEEFEHFLWVFYNPRYDVYEADIRVWFTILRLAHEWDFPEVTRFALREVKRRENEIGLVERIVLYQTYHAPAEFLVPLFAELCARPTSPTDEETHLLGFEQTVKIYRARERLRSSGGVSPLPPGTSEADTYPTISTILGLPQYTGRSVLDQDDDANTMNGAPIVRAPVKKNNNGRTSGKT
ncbi:hypothetical protein D9611_003697 [Ephemerocybe angulata]|uniref:BTB domain-containing protein n=1 Tax=Ephemerocybe angulata TaxID=980116 RepID=A0A8H5B524_9AGAR|nr:hypothetical protein D9611_003697 [Tulosesus angulatus]